MSVWQRFQRVGRKAAKFRFTASYSELSLECAAGFSPGKVVVTWTRRSRKYHSEPIKPIEVKTKPSCYSYVWEVPRNEEIVTTLYKMKKELQYEEKDWTFQLEDVGQNGTHRRLLGYRNINMAEYADIMPTQNNIKINFKISYKKMKSATLFLTLSGVFIKEGEATDDDMMSVASMMSLPSNQNFAPIQDSDIARLSDFDDTSLENSANFTEKFNELFDKIGALDCEKYSPEEVVVKDDTTKDSTQSLVSSFEKPSPGDHNSNLTLRLVHNPIPPEEDRLSNIEEEDRSPTVEHNSTVDLLDWCKFITCGYKNVSITNFTTSFRNGIAFCAIIHYFHPELLDFDSLKPSNVKENNRIAFTAAAKLGIPKVLDPNEMNFLKVPDSLSIMTYLHQLRAYFTENTFVITPASISNHSPHSYKKQVSSLLATTPTESTIFEGVEPKDKDTLGRNSFATLPQSCADLKKESSEALHLSGDIKDEPLRDSYGLRNDNQGSPCAEIFTPKTNGLNPLQVSSKSDSNTVIKKSPKKTKVKLSSLNVDGTIKEGSSWSEKKIKRVNLGKLNLLSEHNINENHPLSASPQHSSSEAQISPKKVIIPEENNFVENNYICAETAALEREQEKIDEEASKLEKLLREVMNKDKQQESILMDKWFILVNKKNALIRRNMQLQILDKEQDLEKKWTLLQNELRQINSIEDWNKTEDMKRREDLLMKDLINIINQRDKVVRDLDNYEKGIADDMEWAKTNPESTYGEKISKTLANAKFSDKNCVLQ